MKVLFYILLVLLLAILSLVIYNYWPIKPLPPSTVIDLIVVDKAARKMHVYQGSVKLKSYRIALGKEPVGDKLFEGDNRTPEGRYTIVLKNEKSKFHLSLRISYPSPEDRLETSKLALPGRGPGGDIMIHGLPNGMGFLGRLHRLRDWTAGCIAVTNQEIRELFDHVVIGAEIEIGE